MSGVKAVLTTAEVAQFGGALDQLALKLGRDTVFTSRQAAAAIEELVKAGVPVETVLNGGATAALNLAAATGVTTNEAATIAAQALNTFSLSGEQATAVVDRLSAVANASASDISFLRFGIAATGGVAAALGLTFNDEAVALGLFSKSFANGSDAGTSFKTFLERLNPTTKSATEEMKKLGIVTADGSNQFFDASGHVKDLAGIAGVLRTALGGLNDQQRLTALQTIFGTDAIRAGIALYTAGADGVRQFAEQTGQGGEAAASAKTRLDNLEGTLNNLGGSIETVQIIVGQRFLQPLRAVADTVRGLVDRFGLLSPSMQNAIVNFALVGGAVAGLVGGFVLLAPIILAIGPSFLALAGILAGAAPIFAVLGLAAFGLAAAWRSNFGGLRDTVTATFDRIGPILANFGLVFEQAFTGNIGGAADTFLAIIGAIAPGLATVLLNIRTTISGFFDTFGPVLSNFGVVLQKVLAGDLGGAFDTFRAIVGTISGPLGELLGVFQGIGGFVRDTIVPFLSDLAVRVMPALGQVSGALAQLWDTKLSPAFQTIAIWLSGTLVPFFVKLGAEALPALEKVSGTLAAFWDEKMQPAFQKVGDFIDQNLLKSLADLGTGLGNLSGEKVAAIGAAFGGTLLQSLSAFGAQLQPLVPVFQSVGSFFASVGSVFAAFAELQSRAAPGAPAEDPLTSSLQRLADFVTQNAGLGDRLLLLLPGGTFLKDLADQGPGVAAFFNNLADALNKFAKAINELPALPPWLQLLIQGNVGGAAVAGAGELGLPGAGGPRLTQSAFTPGGAGAGGGPVLNFNAPVSINGAGDLADFAQSIAAAIAASSRRVTVPPDNTSNPQLSTGII